MLKRGSSCGKVAGLLAAWCSAVLAHPHCWVDSRAVDLDQVLTFCPSEYAESGACCTDDEEDAIEAEYDAAGTLSTDCADYYLQLLCGVCGSYSGHLYERLGDELDTDGLTMKSEFCEGLTTACDGEIDFQSYDGVDYCTKHTGGGDDLWWSYPYEQTEVFAAGFTEAFPDLSDDDKPSEPIAMHQSPDDSMFWIAGKYGEIKEVDATDLTTSTTVLDLSSKDDFYTSYEEGLLDFAFSPMFTTNSYFYVNYVYGNESNAHNRLSKMVYYSGDPTSTLGSEEILMNSSVRSAYMHNGGWMGFKPGDYGTTASYHELYWTLGDSGPQKDTNDYGQRTDVLFGSVVRISVPSSGTGYTVPSDNYPDAELSEICAIGFRNPWRCGFDRETDELYCGDVGHLTIESIKLVECGNNYGWKRFEGTRCTEYSEDEYGDCATADRSDLTEPFFEYCHEDYESSPSSQDDYTNGNDICGDKTVEGNTVIGGYVYRGAAYADLLYGAYIFADYTKQNIYYIDGDTVGTLVSDNSAVVYSFAEDNDGELYIINSDGDIYYLPCDDLCITDTTTTTDDTVTSTTTDDAVTSTTDDTATSSTTDDAVTSTTTDDTATSSTTDDAVTSTTTDDTAMSSTTDDAVTSTATDDTVMSSTTDDAVTSTTTDDVTSATTDDGTSSSATLAYLGCYADNTTRVLTGDDFSSSDMTVEVCAAFCSAYAYCGLEYSNECFCGHATDEPTSYGAATCDSACTGDADQICGGTWAISVYTL